MYLILNSHFSLLIHMIKIFRACSRIVSLELPFISYLYVLHHRMNKVGRYNGIKKLLSLFWNEHEYIGQIFVINYTISNNATNQYNSNNNQHWIYKDCSSSFRVQDVFIHFLNKKVNKNVKIKSLLRIWITLVQQNHYRFEK